VAMAVAAGAATGVETTAAMAAPAATSVAALADESSAFRALAKNPFFAFLVERVWLPSSIN
jgi:hypothetical protein